MQEPLINRRSILARIENSDCNALTMMGLDEKAREAFTFNCAEITKRLQEEPVDQGITITAGKLSGTVSATTHAALVAFLRNENYAAELNTFHFEVMRRIAKAQSGPVNHG